MANSCGSIISILSESTSFAGADARGRVRPAITPRRRRSTSRRRPTHRGRCSCWTAAPLSLALLLLRRSPCRVCRLRPHLLLAFAPGITLALAIACWWPGIGRPIQLHHRRSCVHDFAHRPSLARAYPRQASFVGFGFATPLPWPPTHQPEASQRFRKQFWIKNQIVGQSFCVSRSWDRPLKY